MTIVFALCALLMLIAIRTPIGLALGVSGTIGIVLLEGWEFAGKSLSGIPSSTIIQNGLIVIPLFVLMGYLLLHAGLAQEIFNVAGRVVGTRVPGGLGVAAVLACAAFAGVTGSSAATVASIGRISYLEMRRHGYKDSFAAGIVAMAGTLGVMIPPSAFLVIYAILAEVSVNEMLLAGILPGLLSAAAYIAVIVAYVRRPNQTVIAPALTPALAARSIGAAAVRLDGVGGSGASPDGVGMPKSAVARSRGRLALVTVALLFVTILGGMYVGLFTATEAGAVGASAALIITIGVLLMERKSPWKPVGRALMESTTSTSMIALLLVGGGVFSYFLVLARVPRAITDFALAGGLPGWLVVAGLLLVLLILGAVLDGMSMLLIITPLAIPVIAAFDYNLIWFGILMVKAIEIGMVTPPLGINVYVLAGGVKGLKAERAFSGVVPFWVAELATMVLIFVFPVIALIIPQTAAG